MCSIYIYILREFQPSNNSFLLLDQSIYIYIYILREFQPSNNSLFIIRPTYQLVFVVGGN